MSQKEESVIQKMGRFGICALLSVIYVIMWPFDRVGCFLHQQKLKHMQRKRVANRTKELLAERAFDKELNK